MKFDKLVERQILKAEVEGQLAGLKGEGEPLDLKPEADPAAASGFRIMAQAGALPREIQLRKDIEKKLAALAALADPSLRKGGNIRTGHITDAACYRGRGPTQILSYGG